MFNICCCFLFLLLEIRLVNLIWQAMLAFYSSALHKPNCRVCSDSNITLISICANKIHRSDKFKFFCVHEDMNNLVSQLRPTCKGQILKMIKTQIWLWQDKCHFHTVRSVHLHCVALHQRKMNKQGRTAVESHWTDAIIEINKCEASNINEISHIWLHYSPSTYIEISSAFLCRSC